MFKPLHLCHMHSDGTFVTICFKEYSGQLGNQLICTKAHGRFHGIPPWGASLNHHEQYTSVLRDFVHIQSTGNLLQPLLVGISVFAIRTGLVTRCVSVLRIPSPYKTEPLKITPCQSMR